MQEVKVALIGFGGIARAHNAGYKILKEENEPIKLVAVCDINPAQFESEILINTGSGEGALPADIHTYTNVDDLLESEDFDMADICLPSYLHKEYAIKLMKAGKHVLSEKPMALSYADCNEMISVSESTGKKLMIGQCLRFDAGYMFLKECVDNKTFGEARHAYLYRLSSHPKWGFEHWFEDDTKSGGCVLDMHIHDVDMVRFLFGEPEAISMSSLDTATRWAVDNTQMYYPGKLVSIAGSWDESDTFGFRAGFRIRFEKATITMDGGKIIVYPNEGDTYSPALPATNYMAEEVRFFAHSIMDENIKNTKNPPESARETVRLIEKLRESAACGGKIIKL